MHHGNIIIQEAHTVIQYAGSYVILLILRLRQSPAQCLCCLVLMNVLWCFKRFFMFQPF